MRRLPLEISEIEINYVQKYCNQSHLKITKEALSLKSFVLFLTKIRFNVDICMISST